MTQTTDTLIKRLSNANPGTLLANRRVGLEKESLRVTEDALLAKTPHPEALGAALTHPYITMDFSEALLEFITPPLESNTVALDFMADIHTLVAQHLDNEILWAGSMPCITKGETDVPLAYFGTSNAGMMKTIYRSGIGYRYGKTMQTIAGVHYNYSFAPELWPALIEFCGITGDERDARDTLYMRMLRNVLRSGWIIPFLFGSSPAICRTFVDTPERFQTFDASTLYYPNATSLRMGNIGYQNNQEVEAGILTSYNSLREYALSLKRAIETPFERYQRIGIKVDGAYRQLNDHLLQIENELYVTARPKRATKGSMEMPLLALMRNGIEYIELRSLDVLTHSPTGVMRAQLDFIEAWLTFCLLDSDSPIDNDEMEDIDLNEVLVAHEGRNPDLTLRLNGKKTSLRDAGLDLCARMTDVCGLLDDAHQCSDYTDTLNRQRDLFVHPGHTPSARMLEEMRTRQESYIEFMQRVSCLAHDEHLQRDITAGQKRMFDDATRASVRKQEKLEQSDTQSLDEYIATYFAGLEEVSELARQATPTPR